MISLEKLKEVMNQNGLEYSKEELLLIRDFLYRLAEIAVSHYERKQDSNTKVISINKTDHYDQKESIPICQGEHRRAS
jgi:hypothetical protein